GIGERLRTNYTNRVDPQREARAAGDEIPAFGRSPCKGTSSDACTPYWDEEASPSGRPSTKLESRSIETDQGPHNTRASPSKCTVPTRNAVSTWQISAVSTRQPLRRGGNDMRSAKSSSSSSSFPTDDGVAFADRRRNAERTRSFIHADRCISEAARRQQ